MSASSSSDPHTSDPEHGSDEDDHLSPNYAGNARKRVSAESRSLLGHNNSSSSSSSSSSGSTSAAAFAAHAHSHVGHRHMPHIPHTSNIDSAVSASETTVAGILDDPDEDEYNADTSADANDPQQREKRRKAVVMLTVFTCINLLTYFDRGSIGVALSTIMQKGVYDLSNFEGGVLAGAYMFGYISASPVFALAVKHYDPFRIIAFGLGIWSLAAVGAAVSIGFVSLLLARAVSGIGEAAFLCIAPPFVDKCAPAAQKSRWMAVFYCAIPVGYALGFVISGHWLNFSLLPVYYHWRIIFVFECALMLPLIIWVLTTRTPKHNFADPPPPKQHALDEMNEPISYRESAAFRKSREREETQRRAAAAATAAAANQHDASSSSSSSSPSDPSSSSSSFDAHTDASFSDYLTSVAEVLGNKVYVLIVLGYAAQTFVLGSVAYFGVRYLMENFSFSVGKAGSYFGGITVVVGIVGSLVGGWACDYMRQGMNKAHATAQTMKLAFVLSLVSFPLCLASFAKNTPEYFFSFFVVAEFILFATASPINSAVIWAVPFRLTPLACSVSIMVIHILGDAISPAIVGAILDLTKNNWRLTMTLNTCWLVWCILFWLWAWRAAVARAQEIDALIVQRDIEEAAERRARADEEDDSNDGPKDGIGVTIGSSSGSSSSSSSSSSNSDGVGFVAPSGSVGFASDGYHAIAAPDEGPIQGRRGR